MLKMGNKKLPQTLFFFFILLFFFVPIFDNARNMQSTFSMTNKYALISYRRSVGLYTWVEYLQTSQGVTSGFSLNDLDMLRKPVFISESLEGEYASVQIIQKNPFFHLSLFYDMLHVT